MKKYQKYKLKANMLYGGEINIEIIQKLLEKYFDASNIIVSFIDDELESQYYVKIVCDDSDINSTDFFINKADNNIYISNLAKCGNITGTVIVTKIISFAKDIKSGKIFLIDASQIFIGEDCEMDMAKYMILLYGYSWYNKFGFYNLTHERDTIYNEKMCKKTFNDFIEYGIKRMRIKKKEKFNDEIYDKETILSSVLQIDDKININMTIREVMIILSDKNKKNNFICDDVANTVKIIVNIAKFILMYNPKLELKI
jgi:hypothetical protein